MSNTTVTQCSYSKKGGYVWRKRYAKEDLSIALQTQETVKASVRSAAMSIRFMQLEQLAVPFVAMREALKAYRNELVMKDKLAMLQGMASQEALQSVNEALPMREPTHVEKVAQATIQREIEQQEGHTLESTKEAYFKANTEWREKTIKDYSTCIDRFIVWASTAGVNTVEAVSKDTIIDFKAYMDEAGLAPLTKNKVLVRIGSMFNFAVNIKEWIVKNPVNGLMYKNNEVQKPKIPVLPEEYRAVMAQNTVKNDNQTFWCITMLYYTGMRISELQQVTKEDYIEVEGIKCVSVNTIEEGKTLKTKTSKRNIPLCDALLALGVWDVKPVMKNGANRNMEAVTRSFKLIGLKRTSHCFRYGISDRLRDVDCEDSTRNFILGHAQETMTDRVYISRTPLLKMQRALNEANQ